MENIPKSLSGTLKNKKLREKFINFDHVNESHQMILETIEEEVKLLNNDF